jgi:hypothetical protein
MKISHKIIGIAFIAALTGCSSTTGQSTTQVASNIINRQNVTITTPQYLAPAAGKNPQNIAFYSKTKEPHAPYRVIGTATVSKYNLLGVERKNDTMHTMMKDLAASVGGDGLIDVSSNKDSLQANIIQFQKIMI